MEPDKSLLRLPAMLVNPAAIEALVKKREIKRTTAVRRPLLSSEAQMLPITFQLSREHLDAMREEIAAAEPVLHNVYEDIDLFNQREQALNDVLIILLRMREALENFPIYESRKDSVRKVIDYLIEDINLIVAVSKRNTMPLLEPMSRVAPFSQSGAGVKNQADIVFILSRAPGTARDVKMLALNLHDFYNELRNFGLDVRLGLQTYGRTSQPSGPMRATPEDFLEDLYSMQFGAESWNALGAIQSTVDDFALRQDSSKHFIILADTEAHDDFGDMREQTAERLVSERVTFHALSVNDRFTGFPLMVYDDIARTTGGMFINIDRTEYRSNISALTAGIFHKAVDSGAAIVASQDRIIPVGPDSAEFITARFPDFRPSALGVVNLKLESEDDFRIACSIVERAISNISMDKLEKRMLQDYLSRILSHFDDIRSYRLDFRV